MLNNDAIIANTADAERIGLACEALVTVLGTAACDWPTSNSWLHGIGFTT
jgi:hypothetical protein